MSDELVLNGKQYVSSKIAAERTGYARDYIGQLSRGGLIDAERVGGLWYVSLESLDGYERNAEVAKTLNVVNSGSNESQSTLIFEGKQYISASRASKLTRYNQDYIGQLARGSKIPSRQIGNRWYVDHEALVRHKAEKDSLLAAVQSESVGFLRHGPGNSSVELVGIPNVSHVQKGTSPELTYSMESADMLPKIKNKEAGVMYPVSNFTEIRTRELSRRSVSSEILPTRSDSITEIHPELSYRTAKTRNTRKNTAIMSGLLTTILLLSIGFATFKGSNIIITIKRTTHTANMSATAVLAASSFGDMIERLVSTEIIYNRDK